jgi:hypothetical protein
MGLRASSLREADEIPAPRQKVDLRKLRLQAWFHVRYFLYPSPGRYDQGFKYDISKMRQIQQQKIPAAIGTKVVARDVEFGCSECYTE